MENKFKNEMEIEIAGEKILLRPTFDNVAAMETKLGSVASLAYKYGKNVDKDSDPMNALSSLPALSESAQIIFYNQAEKKYSIDEIFEMCLSEGVKVGAQVIFFLVRITAGNKMLRAPSENQKKNSLKKSQVEKV